MKQNIVIIGATSAIAQAVARVYAPLGHRFFLVARNKAALDIVADDLRARGAFDVQTALVDLTDFTAHPPLIADIVQKMDNRLDIVLVAHGTLGNQQAAQQDFAIAETQMRNDFLSVVSILTPLANVMEQQRSGSLAVIGSVAGDRGRQSNYVYGTAKGAVALFVQGIRNRLHRSSVHVLTIKPGFVNTPMTAGLTKRPFESQPDIVGRDIVRAIAQRKDVLYTPWIWRWIMLIIKLIPEAIFKKTQM